MLEPEFDRRVRDWLEQGPTRPSGWVLESVLEHARRRPQRRGLSVAWRELRQTVSLRHESAPALRIGIVLAVVAVGLAVVGLLSVGGPTNPVAGPTSAPSRASPPTSVSTCPQGTDPDRVGPTDQERPVEFFGPVAFDRESRHLVAVDRAHPSIWTFDVCTNTWRRSGADLFDVPGAMAYDDATGLTVLFGSRVRTYDVETDALGARRQTPVSEDVHAVSRTTSGQVIVRDDTASRLWTYDVADDTWQEVDQAGDIPPGEGTGASLLAYDASVDRLVLFVAMGERRESFEFDFGTSTWTRQASRPPELILVWGDLGRYEIAFDEGSARTLIFSRGRVIAYDAAAHAWEVVFDSLMEADPPVSPGDPSHRQAVALAYDSVSRRTLAVGGNRRTGTDWFAVDDVIAFDLDTRTWIELLAQSVP